MVFCKRNSALKEEENALKYAKEAIMESFSDVGTCILEENPQKVKKLTKRLVDTHVENYALSWSKQPAQPHRLT